MTFIPICFCIDEMKWCVFVFYSRKGFLNPLELDFPITNKSK
jgi:hypothetical protein